MVAQAKSVHLSRLRTHCEPTMGGALAAWLSADHQDRQWPLGCSAQRLLSPPGPRRQHPGKGNSPNTEGRQSPESQARRIWVRELLCGTEPHGPRWS